MANEPRRRASFQDHGAVIKRKQKPKIRVTKFVPPSVLCLLRIAGVDGSREEDDKLVRLACFSLGPPRFGTDTGVIASLSLQTAAVKETLNDKLSSIHDTATGGLTNACAKHHKWLYPHPTLSVY